ncbi:MAG: hypothetical protein EBU90_19565 [Proteobacteria bacterium]|nr:hypothetical protein [Pseudomonadota bacterium]NBP15719.1 hypothetical protein [bacterium]
MGKTNVTHSYRHTVTKNLLEGGSTSLSVKLFGRWSDNSAMEGYESSSFKLEGMIDSSEWDGKDKFYCWWESPEGSIPKELLDRVFPLLDSVTQLAEYVRGRYPQGSGDNSAYEVCNVFR